MSKNLSEVEKLAEISLWTMVRYKRFSYRQIRITIVQRPIIYLEPLSDNVIGISGDDRWWIYYSGQKSEDKQSIGRGWLADEWLGQMRRESP